MHKKKYQESSGHGLVSIVCILHGDAFVEHFST